MVARGGEEGGGERGECIGLFIWGTNEEKTLDPCPLTKKRRNDIQFRRARHTTSQQPGQCIQQTNV